MNGKLFEKPSSLDELLIIVRERGIWKEAAHNGGWLDWNQLPTFGGSPPEDMRHVLSWDENRVMIGLLPGTITLTSRSEQQNSKESRCNRASGKKEVQLSFLFDV